MVTDGTTLWEQQGPPFQRHSPTSREAACKIRGVTAAQRAAVYAFIHDQGARGATDLEIADALQLSGSSARPRRIELVTSGVVIDSGTTRKTASGRNAVVWRVK